MPSQRRISYIIFKRNMFMLNPLVYLSLLTSYCVVWIYIVLVWRGEVSKLHQHGVTGVLRYVLEPWLSSWLYRQLLVWSRAASSTWRLQFSYQPDKRSVNHKPFPSAQPPGLTAMEAFGFPSSFTVERRYVTGSKPTARQSDCCSSTLALQHTLYAPGHIIYTSALASVKWVQ